MTNEKNKKLEDKEEKKLKKEKFRKMFKRDKTFTKAFKEKEENYRVKKIKYYVSRITLIIISIILLLLFSNRTFFKENYTTSKINIKIPLLTFFVKDDGNEIKLKTLRKTKYVEKFFDERLINMPRYSCDGYSFFYDEDNKTAIYNISVQKNIAVKTITINYAVGNADCLCDAKVTGHDAEELCKSYRP